MNWVVEALLAIVQFIGAVVVSRYLLGWYRNKYAKDCKRFEIRRVYSLVPKERKVKYVCGVVGISLLFVAAITRTVEVVGYLFV
ncbi:hypothetical protein FT641_18800 [Bacillus paranthracis]|uniref:hypothetical protein n=1 Tax=Bacillus paranthracis TaxID=2026186 RepID=UPI0018796F23|nr:hypothetical protein [Bacillus paranthracis]MBE7114386.1 hypothetical protein [Bacillus paranthracis]MBE7154741.1 hypothetical protein [Bacillus paranthracis]